MKIGIKNGNIVIFSETLDGLEANAVVRGITLDSIEETNEKIVPYYNTENDGIYFRESEVPQPPAEIANLIARSRRRESYAALSDPITNNISVLRDRIAQGDFASDAERRELEAEIATLHVERKGIREQIVADNPLF